CTTTRSIACWPHKRSASAPRSCPPTRSSTPTRSTASGSGRRRGPQLDTGYDVAMSELGDLIRSTRLRKGASQRSLARRAGTTQAAISRIESGRESPSFERFTTLMLVLGERPLLGVHPLELDVD